MLQWAMAQRMTTNPASVYSAFSRPCHLAAAHSLRYHPTPDALQPG
ncbi:hypothetical protein IAE37_001520 [Pseudomonas sp. S31]|nr:hypothetical protein [Pseudomonas sp. S31]